MKRCGIHATRWPSEPTVPCASSYANLPEDLRGRGHGMGWGTGQMLVKPILHGKTGSWEVAEPSFMDSSQQRFPQ